MAPWTASTACTMRLSSVPSEIVGSAIATNLRVNRGVAAVACYRLVPCSNAHGPASAWQDEPVRCFKALSDRFSASPLRWAGS